MINAEKENYLKQFGSNLKKLRLSKNLSQAQLSYIVDLDVMTISRIERGLLNISILNAHKISNALGISNKDLFDF
ncbi:MAG: helix-turn-helix transcriptional regulator [Bacteroidia bacterium]|nr:helix-turn-helix transcriptional regulator [Bacteroidia bacterium]